MPTKDPEKLRGYRRVWYQNNKEHAIAKVVERRKFLKQWLADHKSMLSCSCGENHPACLEFHHRDPTEKECSISHAVHAGWSISRIEDEIAKCDVLCSNCHRKFHHDELGSPQER